MNKYNAPFWTATFERIFFTFLQAYFGSWIVGDFVFDVFAFDWVTALGPALGAAILCAVKCLIAAQVNHPGSPSFANEAAVQTGRHAAPDPE